MIVSGERPIVSNWATQPGTRDLFSRKELAAAACDVMHDYQAGGDRDLDDVLQRALSELCRRLGVYMPADPPQEPKLLPTPQLTPREREVMFLTAKGFNSREVGERLSIGENTVNQRMKCIYDKLGISSKAELGVWASRLGVV